MENKTIRFNNRIISYGVTGIGYPVVLLHGFGEDSTIWENQIEALKRNYFLITPNIPGSGSSELTDDVSMEGIAEIVKLITDAEEVESFILIGHSMGGYATLAFVEKYSYLLKGFGLFHSSAYADSEEKKTTRRKGIAFIQEHGSNEFLKTTTPNLFSDYTKENNPEMVSYFIKHLPDFSKPALIEYYEAMIARPDRTNVLKKTDLPVLFIIGEQDIAVPFEDSLKQSTLPAASNITILKNSGHMGMLEESKKSNQAIITYLEDVLN
ncbi:MAG: alpha/beta fold hydrolase [Niabella sp.]